MSTSTYAHVDDALIQSARTMIDRELKTFGERTPRSAQWLADAERVMPGGVPMAWMRSLYRHAPVVAVRGSGSRFEDLDGNIYLDFNACDLAMPAGFAPEPIVRAIHEDMDPDLSGLDPATAQTTDALPYNDPDALRARLSRGDVAVVLVESALTNCGLVLPTPEFVASLNTDVRAAGAVLIVDETHVQFAVHGGGTIAFGLEPDMLTGGKGIGGGVPIGVIGMTDAIADVVTAHRDNDPGLVDTGDGYGLAVGGTLYGNALSMAAARVGLAEIFTPEAGRRVDALGERLQSGLQREVDRVGLPWTIDRLGGRIQFRLTPEAPRTGAQSYDSIVLPLADARKVFLLNRGIWDSIATAGPSVSYAITEADVDTYIEAAGEFLDELTR